MNMGFPKDTGVLIKGYVWVKPDGVTGERLAHQFIGICQNVVTFSEEVDYRLSNWESWNRYTAEGRAYPYSGEIVPIREAAKAVMSFANVLDCKDKTCGYPITAWGHTPPGVEPLSLKKRDGYVNCGGTDGPNVEVPIPWTTWTDLPHYVRVDFGNPEATRKETFADWLVSWEDADPYATLQVLSETGWQVNVDSDSVLSGAVARPPRTYGVTPFQVPASQVPILFSTQCANDISNDPKSWIYSYSGGKDAPFDGHTYEWTMPRGWGYPQYYNIRLR
jgi:hypothetical protein